MAAAPTPEPDPAATLARLLRRLRGVAELTRRAVSDALGVAESAIESWEAAGHAHQRLPGARNLTRALELYGASDSDGSEARRLLYAAAERRGR